MPRRREADRREPHRRAGHYPEVDPKRLKTVRAKILAWARSEGRHFFWREHGVDPFAILVTEMLLSRTRAEAVEPVVLALLARFPDPARLAAADLGEVERILYPLGLYKKRAKHLLACAESIAREHAGEVPREIEAMMRLPYVGRYAAHAVACVAFGAPQPVIDVNVARVYERVFSLPEPPPRLSLAHDLWAFAARLVPKRRAREFNWALLDLGGTICTARAPRCHLCPIAALCDAHCAGSCAETPPKLEGAGRRAR